LGSYKTQHIRRSLSVGCFKMIAFLSSRPLYCSIGATPY
jgi:hypothetical protein